MKVDLEEGIWAWIGLIWLRIWICGGFVCTLGFRQRWEFNTQLKLLASQEVHCSVELR
jgi:hypothetical protein